MNLTDHFSLESLVASDTAVRMGIDNTPPVSIIAGPLNHLAQALERTRNEALSGYPVYVSSGYRCEALERVLCHHDFVAWCGRKGLSAADPKAWSIYFATKAHPQGYAADVISPRFGTPEDIVRAVSISTIPFDQIIVEGSKDHCWAHLSFAPALRGIIMTATFDASGTPHYVEGIHHA